MVQYGTNRYGHLIMIINPWVQHFRWPLDENLPHVFGSKLILKLIKCCSVYCLIEPGI